MWCQGQSLELQFIERLLRSVIPSSHDSHEIKERVLHVSVVVDSVAGSGIEIGIRRGGEGGVVQIIAWTKERELVDRRVEVVDPGVESGMMAATASAAL